MAKGKILICLVVIILTFFLFDLFCFAAHLKKASFLPQWVPQAQFAGYYIAYEKGIYKKYGIDLTIIPGGPGRQSSDFLKNHKADFVTLWLASGIQLRSRGIKLINIAQIVQRSALMFVAKKSKGILTPYDINGKKVGLWDSVFQIQPRAFFKKFNLKVKVVHQSYSVNLFLRDGVDVASAMWYNEYHTILNSGINPDELSTFFFSKYGLNFPEDGIYTLEDFYKKDPNLSRSFVKASIEGWKYAFSHPKEALSVVMKALSREHIPANMAHQKWMLDRMKDIIMPKDAQIPMGKLMVEDYNRVANILKEERLIKRIPDFSSFYKECIDHVLK